MNDDSKRLDIKNYITGQYISLNVTNNLTIRDVVDASEQIAKFEQKIRNSRNKSSGDIYEVLVYSQSLRKSLSFDDLVGDVLKMNFEQLEIKNRFSQTQSELQAITIQIEIKTKFEQLIHKQELKISRFEKIKQIEDFVLREVNQTKLQNNLLRQEDKIQCYFQKRPCQPNQTLQDLNLIDNDQIVIIVSGLIMLKIALNDGSQNQNFSSYFNLQDTLEDVQNFIMERDSQVRYNVALEFMDKQKTYNQSQLTTSINGLKLGDDFQITVKVRYSGGFQKKKKIKIESIFFDQI